MLLVYCHYLKCNDYNLEHGLMTGVLLSTRTNHPQHYSPCHQRSKIGTHTLNEDDKVTYLGVTFDKRLTWKTHTLRTAAWRTWRRPPTSSQLLDWSCRRTRRRRRTTRPTVLTLFVRFNVILTLLSRWLLYTGVKWINKTSYMYYNLCFIKWRHLKHVMENLLCVHFLALTI